MERRLPVTVVTGASSGIGRSLALRLADGGEAVALLARRKPLLDDVVREVEKRGGRAAAFACDVTDRANVLESFGAVERVLGPVDRLIANAGGGERTYVDGFTATQIERAFAVNVGGAATCIEAVLPGMLARGAGHLVATSSLAACRGLPNAAAYGAAKAALSNLMESLRIELRPRGIDVTLIQPGFVRKPTSKKPRPFEIDLEAATRLMHRAIIERRPAYGFPLPLVMLTALGRLMPAALYDRLMQGRVKRQPAPESADRQG
jgi:NAD(P)-dependent dehydrogenase (short-subunit alcohol dehydrogenase family)